MENREIKFKAWQDNKMLISPISSNYGLNRFFGLLYEDAPVMQYTGLKDKNGVDIYEGDIVKWKHGEGTGIGNCGHGVNHIGYDNKSAGFGLFDNVGFTFKGLDIFRWDPFALEVIGNIYQNPTL